MPDPVPGAVLLIEDEEELRSLFAMLLEMEKLTVFQAPDGVRALELLELHGDSIRLVISDLNLPRLGGTELLSRIRSMKPDVKLIGTSGLGEEDMPEKVMAAGANAFIPKPFHPQDAIKKVKEVLGQP
ncbi:MAG: response regulator [Bacteroidetes bacterium]|nr:response regulator [Bacteroidota bacterium]